MKKTTSFFFTDAETSKCLRSEGSEFDMKYHVLHDFTTFTPFEEKSSDHFKDLHKMELLTNFDISLTSFLGGVTN